MQSLFISLWMFHKWKGITISWNIHSSLYTQPMQKSTRTFLKPESPRSIFSVCGEPFVAEKFPSRHIPGIVCILIHRIVWSLVALASLFNFFSCIFLFFRQVTFVPCFYHPHTIFIISFSSLSSLLFFFSPYVKLKRSQCLLLCFLANVVWSDLSYIFPLFVKQNGALTNTCLRHNGFGTDCETQPRKPTGAKGEQEWNNDASVIKSFLVLHNLFLKQDFHYIALW